MGRQLRGDPCRVLFAFYKHIDGTVKLVSEISVAMAKDADRSVPFSVDKLNNNLNGPAKASELCQYLGWLRQVFDLS